MIIEGWRIICITLIIIAVVILFGYDAVRNKITRWLIKRRRRKK